MVEKIRELKNQGALQEASDELNWIAYRESFQAPTWPRLADSTVRTGDFSVYHKYVSAADRAAMALRWQRFIRLDQSQMRQAREDLLHDWVDGCSILNGETYVDNWSRLVQLSGSESVKAWQDLFVLAMGIYRNEAAALQKRAEIQEHYRTFTQTFGEKILI